MSYERNNEHFRNEKGEVIVKELCGHEIEPFFRLFALKERNSQLRRGPCWIGISELKPRYLG